MERSTTCLKRAYISLCHLRSSGGVPEEQWDIDHSFVNSRGRDLRCLNNISFSVYRASRHPGTYVSRLKSKYPLNFPVRWVFRHPWTEVSLTSIDCFRHNVMRKSSGKIKDCNKPIAPELTVIRYISILTKKIQDSRISVFSWDRGKGLVEPVL